MELTDYLTKPGNLEFAIELADYLRDLKKRLHPQFLEGFNHSMVEKLEESEYSSDWSYKKFRESSPKKDYMKSYMTPLKQEGSILAFAMGQGQRQNNYNLYWGAQWNTTPKEIPGKLITQLDSLLVDLNINFESPGWIRWGFTQYTIHSAEFLRRMHNHPVDLLGEVTNNAWEIFLKLRPLLEEINEQMGKQ